ncbi:type VII toxin-antitoxin system HepT family RNase toxin [Clostridium sp.]
MVYTNIIRRKLINLSEYIEELEPLLEYSYEQYISNYFIKRTGERLIQLIVENMVDINSIIISEMNHPPSKDYYSSFEIIGELEILPKDFASELAPCTGMRNRLVHEYDKIQDKIVFDSIKQLIEMVNRYIEYINKH